MADLPPVEKVIEALHRSAIHGHPMPDERKNLLDILSVMGPEDQYVLAASHEPGWMVGILLGYCIAKAEER